MEEYSEKSKKFITLFRADNTLNLRSVSLTTPENLEMIIQNIDNIELLNEKFDGNIDELSYAIVEYLGNLVTMMQLYKVDEDKVDSVIKLMTDVLPASAAV